MGNNDLTEVIEYHGGIEEIKFPEDNRTLSKTTDYGEGFYTTEIPKQAEAGAIHKYNERKNKRPKAVPTVSVYILNKEKVLTDFKHKYFENPNDEGLDFIIACRNKQEHPYDYVEGPIADNKIYKFAKKLIEGKITREDFWENANIPSDTHQIMLRNDALDCLDFIKSYIVEEEKGNST